MALNAALTTLFTTTPSQWSSFPAPSQSPSPPPTPPSSLPSSPLSSSLASWPTKCSECKSMRATTLDVRLQTQWNSVSLLHCLICTIIIVSRLSSPLPAGTLDLHSASVAYSRTSSQVYLQCVYTNGSTASGCQFSATMTTSDGTHTQTVTVSREESSGSCATIVG